MKRTFTRRRRRTLDEARAAAEIALKRNGDPAAAAAMAPARARPRHQEDDEQRQVIVWALGTPKRPGRVHTGVPVLALLHAIPNGGTRDENEAARMQGQGVRAGVPDLELPVPRYEPAPYVEFIGLRIEMKRRLVKGEQKPRVSPEQCWWLEVLRLAGWCVCVCYGADEAIATIEAYITGADVPHQWTPPAKWPETKRPRPHWNDDDYLIEVKRNG